MTDILTASTSDRHVDQRGSADAAAASAAHGGPCPAEDAVQVRFDGAFWIVQVSESCGVRMMDFLHEHHARTFSQGQRLRLRALTDATAKAARNVETA